MADDFLILADAAAIERTTPGQVTELTKAATDSTFQRDGLSAEQAADIARIVGLSSGVCIAAAAAAHQHLAMAFDDEGLGGFVVATVHGADNRELDWLMVHPRLHGASVSRALMQAGLEWLGLDRPVWLNVLRHNERAIAFYRRFGFEVDESTPLARQIPSWVMRRPADR